MAIFFGKKKGDDNTPDDNGPGEQVVYSPEKAKKFFDHAQTVHEASNYQYAVQSWLSGLKLDPHSMRGTEGFFQSINAFRAEGKKAVDKEVAKSVSGKSTVEKYLAALLESAQKPEDPVLGVKAMDAASKAEFAEPAYFLGERAFSIIHNDKKPRKDLFIKLSDGFAKIGAFDRAVTAREAASQLDPTDGDLKAEIRSMAAQATMHRGGFDATGQAGGFRKNIRDAEKQRQLEESERLVKTEETIDRLIADAVKALKERPGDLPTNEKYVKLLLERGRPKDEEEAHQRLMKLYADSNQFRYREQAGDIKIRKARREASELRHMAEQAPGDEMVGRMHEQAKEKLAKLELDEYKLRVENYPTDLVRKYELGKRYFALGHHNEAIQYFQQAQSDPKNRVQAMNLLGQSFLAIDWTDEAIETFRAVQDAREVSPEGALELRYWLMVSLQTKAEKDRDLPSAEESERIASSIAVQNIGYRDIRERRDAIKKLVAELRSARPDA